MKYNKHYMRKHGNPDRGMPSRTRPGREDYMTHKGDMYYDESGHRFVKRPYGNPDDRDDVDYAADNIVDMLRESPGMTKTELKRMLRKSEFITEKNVDDALDELYSADIIERFKRGWRLTMDKGAREAMRVSRTMEDMAMEFSNPKNALDRIINQKARGRRNPVRNQTPRRSTMQEAGVPVGTGARGIPVDPREAFVYGVRVGIKRGIGLCGVRNLAERWRRMRELQEIDEAEEQNWADRILREAGFVDAGPSAQLATPQLPANIKKRGS